MPLAAGDKLGPYEILALIGAGGMGEVYKALDPRLNREVAIKVSHAAFTERFAREARSIAALNHPNVCTLYDVGPNYLVMEYVEGEAPKGPMPLDDALRLASQIAEALSAAHEKGITHRDLKPANIKVRPDGTVKVLDFGLAKQSRDREGAVAGDPEHSPTLTIGMTEAGMILGTAAYMPPEQARGKPVDRRADIWSFGVVLYELITGQRPFEGDDVTDTLAAVLRHEPDWERIPPKVRRLLRRCLEKDPAKRLRDIGDRGLLLDETPRTSAPSRSRLSWVAWGVATLAIACTALLAFVHFREKAPPQPLVRLDVDLGSGVSLGSQAGADTIISPDGTRLVYVSKNRLFTRRLEQPAATELAGTEGAFAPFFSPDGQWVAFFAGAKLKKISVEGGAAIALCDAASGRGGSWGQDGNILAALTSVSGVLSRIPSAGGTPTPVTELAQGEATHRWPQILPGGKAVLFTAHTATVGFDGANIEVMSLADRRRKTLVRGATYGRYLPSGHLLYINRGTLFAVPFDLDSLAMRGTPSPLLEQIGYSTNVGSAQLDFSRSGTLVYRKNGAGSELVTVQWLESTGKTQPLLAKPGFYQRPHVSPDGQRLLLEVTEGSGSDVWVYEWQRDTMTRLTFGGRGSLTPIWSSDGRFVVFSESAGGMFWTRSDGANKPQPLIQNKNHQVPWSFTADGKWLAFYEALPGSGYDIWTVPVESDGTGLRAGKPEVFLQTSSDERHSFFSPDGRWLAYTSDESGSFQVYVRAFPDKGGKWQISNNGGAYPTWSRNGRELFFRTDDNRIMVADYTVKGDSFTAGKLRAWSERKLANFGLVGVQNYDLAPDGKRIAAIMPAEAVEAQAAPNHVVFLMNFTDELRRRVPAAK
jgi:Tol biopolymer transport system component